MKTTASTPDYSRHPCFNAEVKGKFGRVHLPVAPKCNIQCNYCNRKYDCVNESRPGVTSTILSPEQALVYMDKVLTAEPRISVAGIAGPGDPFANANETLGTMQLLRRHYPDLILCLSSNGLGLTPHVDEVADIGVSHVTVTVNGIDPEVTKNIYSFVRDGKIIYRGLQAAELLLARQMAAIEKLKSRGVTVKINFITIPGINDHHAEATAETMAKMGVDLFNCMAMLPNADTPFADVVEPTKATMNALRNGCERHLPQMRHCKRCRADAVGLLGNDRSGEMAGCLNACATMPATPPKVRPYVAVASMEGMLVNQHLGETTKFLIYGKEDNGYTLVEERKAPPVGGGIGRWEALTRLLYDCRAVIVSDMGESPREVFKRAGIDPITMSGFIEAGLEAVYTGKNLAPLKRRAKKSCGSGACLGTGTGCG
ncbi:nitrogenase cofactor biosynthesis protein NifB [Desulfocapsa sulfexigens DSM 10523]|uniref:FeMo cofactor biosynthesis protein NifB n=1 Tax=Desulfocapsa sulfexigens (strain DSM 10523 / SB164P1) TaxID=1167006 RepID=M1NAT5_DESSD|nr:nitrogenase cofactor biosynthesis protein NifB [Desulfocapsa sulfexigens]AGF76934.1 nitrogenase cofactor biosynthesis protein NifB [Desulfocapsa sulfexigens DSM 10523]